MTESYHTYYCKLNSQRDTISETQNSTIGRPVIANLAQIKPESHYPAVSWRFTSTTVPDIMHTWLETY